MLMGWESDKGTKIYQKWQKQIAVVALIQLYDKGSWLFSTPICNTTSLVLKIHKSTESRHRRQFREGDKIWCSLLRLMSLLCKLFDIVTSI